MRGRRAGSWLPNTCHGSSARPSCSMKSVEMARASSYGAVLGTLLHLRVFRSSVLSAGPAGNLWRRAEADDPGLTRLLLKTQDFLASFCFPEGVARAAPGARPPVVTISTHANMAFTWHEGNVGGRSGETSKSASD